MEQSVDINKKNEYCETPLLKPSYNGINDIVEYLKYMIEHKVDRNKKIINKCKN